jgi:hypothetical protein
MESTIKTTTTTETKKYKPMIMNGIVLKDSVVINNVDNLDAFLEKEKTANMGDPWSKLDKTAKIKKITVFAEKYRDEQNMTPTEYDALVSFLKDCLDRKRLARVKDVVYDKVTGEIKEIPALHFNKGSNHFTLKNIDKQRTSTLKSLPPKKVRSTAKNVTTNDEEDNDD